MKLPPPQATLRERAEGVPSCSAPCRLVHIHTHTRDCSTDCRVMAAMCSLCFLDAVDGAL
jgi:hypothetical protein